MAPRLGRWALLASCALAASNPEGPFNHKRHAPLKLGCATCHTSAATDDRAGFPSAQRQCKVCHSEITAQTRPAFRGGTRIAHDSPEIWIKAHGQEAQFDPAYCAMCHDTVAACEDCHRREKPQNHTVAWRRKAHGLRAVIDQQNCAASHEEEYCTKCHEKTEPASHRAGFGGSLNQHCVSCHYPPQETSCTVCHEEIEHRKAGISPHTFGIFPVNCSACHPGGEPHRAPHLTNNSVSCKNCHE